MNKKIFIGLLIALSLLLISAINANAATVGGVNVSVSISYEQGGQTFADDNVFNATRQNLTLLVSTDKNASIVTCNYRTSTSGAWTKFYENDTDNVPEGFQNTTRQAKCVLDPVNWSITDSTLYFNITANASSSNTTIGEMEYDGTTPTITTSAINTETKEASTGMDIIVNDGSSTCRYGTSDAVYAALPYVFDQPTYPKNTNYTRRANVDIPIGSTTYFIGCSDDHNNWPSSRTSVTVSRTAGGSVTSTLGAVRRNDAGDGVTALSFAGDGKKSGNNSKVNTYMLWGLGVALVVLGIIGISMLYQKGKRRKKR